MKKISASMFFTVLWRSLCQATRWSFGLFGYKRDGRFARCVWVLFAASGALSDHVVINGKGVIVK